MADRSSTVSSDNTVARHSGDFISHVSSGAEPIRGAWMSSPTAVTTPVWVDCSGISPHARSLVTPLIIGAHRVHGDQAPILDRQYLAWHVDGRRPDKLQPLLNELVSIGFLVIYDGGQDEHGRRRKRRDPQTNEVLPDVYALRFDAPANYVGPRGLEDEHQQFLADRDLVYGNAKADGRKAVRRSWTGHLDPSGNPQVSPTPSQEGVESEATPSHKGVDSFPQVSPTPSQEGVSRARSSLLSSSPSGRLGERPEGESEATESAARAAAADPAEESPDDWARQLVRKLPWSTRLKRRVRIDEARDLAVRFRAAAAYGWSEQQVQDHALDALKRSSRSPVHYVWNAFADGRIAAEPMHESLVLPTDIAAPGTASSKDNAVPTASSAESAMPDWCGECNAGGEPARGNARLRYITTPAGREMCTCHPQHPSRIPA